MFLDIKHLTKMFSKEDGVKDFDLEIEKGEFITLLGPSGCGKTTILNMIAGFLKPDEGTILLEGEDITKVPPEKRPVSTVFQSYALFPHMNVIDNVSYGLRYSLKHDKKKAHDMARNYLEIVGLAEYETARVGQLSGGQQQRVALARAMSMNPKILLLDEPLSNLDASLRVKLRDELKILQKKIGITMIFVTHDQSEALSLSDKIVVMDKGTAVQIGTPREIYYEPQNAYVASFIGKSNVMICEGKECMVRPEELVLTPCVDGDYIVIRKSFIGANTEYTLENKMNQRNIVVSLTGKENSDYQVGDVVKIEMKNYVLCR